jgi:hypothetical protein
MFLISELPSITECKIFVPMKFVTWTFHCCILNKYYYGSQADTQLIIKQSTKVGDKQTDREEQSKKEQWWRLGRKEDRNTNEKGKKANEMKKKQTQEKERERKKGTDKKNRKKS